MRVAPSDLHKRDFLKSIPYKKVVAYLEHHGWKLIGTDPDERYKDRLYYYHSKRAKFRNKERLAWYNLPSKMPTTPIQEETGICVPPERFVDYYHGISCLLNDLERHEDRWAGTILQEILDDES